jgi:hypothetical protein
MARTRPDRVHRYFFDCEFIEDGRTIELVSIGVVDTDDREYYAVSTEFDPAGAIDWVRRNVLEKLPSPADPAWRSRAAIRETLHEYLTAPLRAGTADRIELWAWLAAYDHVALAQLWGAMPALPREIPRFTHELRQRWESLGQPAIPGHGSDRHDALADARLGLARWRAMESAAGPAGEPSGVPVRSDRGRP